MRKMLAVVSAFIVVALVPSSAFAWGAAAHRYVMRRAIDLLPAEIKPFFEQNLDELVLRVNDPDLWRNVGWEDDPNHFVDFGVDAYGAYPFAALPRELGAALEKFGASTLKRHGLLPWRESEQFGNLRRAFEGVKRNAPYWPTDIVLFSAVAAHYIQDAHQPLHATNNYDGQLSGQSGVHARFESALFERFEAKMTIDPKPAKGITNARDAAFDTLLESFTLVQPLLAADKAAIAGLDAYDDKYFERFFTGVRGMIERRLAESITATASLVVGAWEQAGKPVLKAEFPRTIQRVRPGDR